MSYSNFAFISVLLMGSICLADQSWREIKPAAGVETVCDENEGADSQKTYGYQNSFLYVCYFDSSDLSSQERSQFSSNKIQLKESYRMGLKKSASATTDWFATEGEVGSHSRTLILQGSSILITEDDGGGHTVLSSTIACKAKECELTPPVCLLKSTPESKKAVSALQAAVKTTKPEKIWNDYFDGKKMAQGQLVIDEAILGSKEAKDLLSKVQPDNSSASGTEVFETIKGDIDRFSRYCAHGPETKTTRDQRFIDCSSKTAPLAKKVCSSSDLRKLDEEVNSLFGAHSDINRSEWYQGLESCKTEMPCLKKEYNDEIFRLKNNNQ